MAKGYLLQSTQFDLTALLQTFFVSRQEQEREKRMIAAVSSNTSKGTKWNLQVASSYRKPELVVHRIKLWSTFLWDTESA